MPAPSKNFSTIADSEIDADSPLDATLMAKIRDALVHLEEWLGHSYTAAQNHNHDGVNSALISIGPNMIRNGGFEDGLTGWTQNAYSGGSIATNTANDMEGLTAVAITSTVIANGGGFVETAALSVTGGLPYRLGLMVKASAANVSFTGEVIWYTDALAQISVTTFASSSNTPTSATAYSKVIAAPATARVAIVRVTGGSPGVGSSAGTVYFDSVYMGDGLDKGLQAGDVLIHSNDADGSNGSATYVKVKETQTGYGGTLRVKFTLRTSSGSDTVAGRIYVNGAAVGTERTTNNVTGVEFSEDIAVATGDLVQVYAKQVSGTPIATVFNFRFYAAAPITFLTLS